jgi:hypothetical protein
MLTRIEVDGFKNLLGFSAEFGPFTCIAGPNAVGKSNLFDAIEFLSLLAELPLDEAAHGVRQTSGSIEPARRLFWNDGSNWAETISIAAEMIVPNSVVDGLGQGANPEAACLRYSIKLRYDKGLRLIDERLEALGPAISEIVRFPHSPEFAEIHAPRLAHPGAVPMTGTIFDLGAGLRPGATMRTFDLANTSQTFLSAYATADHPIVLAANREMASWRRLNLEPAALRMPDQAGRRQQLGGHGEHLPGQMRQLCEPAQVSELWSPYDEDELSAALLSWLQPVASMRKIWVHEDQHSGSLTIRAKLRDGTEVSARDFSDGTLRYLALAVLLLTPGHAMFTIEEPENGLHPDRFADLLELFRELSSDPMYRHPEPIYDETLGEGDPIQPSLRQVIVNTHSSALVREIYKRTPEDLLMASGAFIGRPDGSSTHALRLHPMVETWRCSNEERGVTLPVVSYVGRAVRLRSDASAAEDG